MLVSFLSDVALRALSPTVQAFLMTLRRPVARSFLAHDNTSKPRKVLPGVDAGGGVM
jgi:hypothetical protein